MAALMGFTFLIPALVDGPALRDYWPVFERSCTYHWWKIFTMTENYMDDISDMCLPHYWYIAVDFQLAIVSTVILAAVTPRWPKASLWLMATIAVTACLATGIQVYVKDALPFNIIITTNVRKLIVSQTDIYIKAHTHAAPLFIGVIFGCLATRRHRLSKPVQAVAWLLAATMSLAALLGVRAWSQGRYPERIESVFYAALHRASWALGLSWVMYACTTKRGGLVNKILSWPLFYPLGRLSFSVFLVHIIVLAFNSILSREFITNHPFLHAQAYVSLVITAYAFASIIYLLIECPVAALDNLVFSRLMPKETILKVMQGKATSEEVKYIEALAQSKSKKAFDLASKQTSVNGLPGSSNHNFDDKHICSTNGTLNTNLSEDTQSNGAVISVKF
ncbi:nose resistant to fluoxetine protein 6 [Rhipicephalus microplus]|uniref:nose resistant to fluoxetine protein 6 n=1 Tax=Rhipicephalus microplus TaxID=6941 RepID=UPI003F6D957D